MNPPVPPAIEMPARRRHSPFLKIAGICGLILLLQIPLF
jgi:hypothetical protein